MDSLQCQHKHQFISMLEERGLYKKKRKKRRTLMISMFVESVLTKSTAYLIFGRFLRSRCRNQESKSKKDEFLNKRKLHSKNSMSFFASFYSLWWRLTLTSQ